MATKPNQADLEDVEYLENRARWQRSALEEDLSNLKVEIAQALDANKIARRYFWQIALGLAVGAAGIGYGVAGVFSRK